MKMTSGDLHSFQGRGSDGVSWLLCLSSACVLRSFLPFLCSALYHRDSDLCCLGFSGSSLLSSARGDHWKDIVGRKGGRSQSACLPFCLPGVASPGAGGPLWGSSSLNQAYSMAQLLPGSPGSGIAPPPMWHWLLGSGNTTSSFLSMSSSCC